MNTPRLAGFLVKWAPRLLSVLRIVVGGLFLAHGSQKLLGFPAPAAAPAHAMALWSIGGISGLLELAGGALIVPGLFTRPVAFILSGEMAVAYFMAHAPHGFWPINNHGELAVLYCFVWFYFAAAGAGPWSLDALLERKAGKIAG